jgi:Mor family transcriptional regulator
VRKEAAQVKTQMKDWLQEIEYEDLLNKDAKTVLEFCGLDVLCALYENVPSIPLYLGEKVLFELRKRYIRKFCDGENHKHLAAKLGVSVRFVYDALAETDAKDERQGTLL